MKTIFKQLLILLCFVTLNTLHAQSRPSWHSDDLALTFTKVTDNLYWSNSLINGSVKYHLEVDLNKSIPRYTLVTEPHHDQETVSKVIQYHLRNNGTVNKYDVQEKHEVGEKEYKMYFLVKKKPFEKDKAVMK
ncbi:hypothetical protein MY04_4601 [Flammeovirga sp. MY04]|uniref:hypothetical protein n=1 Tax=Flammeovirga sp. MY04 TaxID=1191459 RepID=UPI00130523BA|nr:hypothetical protein [Flammeovirga sp. MY04]ANQ51936.2 hypothetical protein MY04_4601 [Flammeovirga sp. MY04]